ncbi:MAG: VCBS repeat-containing protein, partial [Flavobacteriales bacterium]
IFHGAADLLPTTYQWSQLGVQASSYLGSSVSSAGDVNGDGYSDVIIGAPSGVSGVFGKAMLYLGSATGLSTTPAWTGTGENMEDLYGYVVASAGDVNGDGYGDVLVGAPAYPNYTWRGKLYLYLGSSTGLSATPAWTKTGENVEDRFGYSASSAGDVNGDGYSDVLVGAYMFGEPTEHGKVYVFNGSSTGLPSVANWTAMGTSSSFYGATVSTAGDVNGDGYDDVIVGAPLHDVIANDNRGGAFLYNGSPSGPSVLPSWSAFGTQSGSQFGVSVSFAGDVNGDGYSDVIVGEYFYTNGANTHTGRAYVFQGSPFTGLPASANTIIEGTQLDGQMGISVCSAGDVNGDGFGDVIVGAHLQSMFYLNQGMASVHLGSAAGTSATAAWSAYGTGTGSRFGFGVALAGDVNGDGYSDVVVGANRQTAANEGGAFVFQGNVARSMPMPTYQYRGDLVTPVRTNNGTFDPGCEWGIGQFARSSMGRSKLKLAWQFVGHGPTVPTSPFNNNSTDLTGEAGSWTDIGLPGVLLKQVLSAASSTTSHPAWRARVRFHPATALDGRTFGRWFAQGVHDLQVPSIKTELMGCGPLPVTLVQASVACVDGQALVEWATASEQDCAEFRVQRSSDGEVWETVGRLPCSGNSSSFLQYQFVDPNPDLTGITYYRLDQFDLNGARERYPVMVLTPCGRQSNMVGWPNPFREELHLDLSGIRADDGPFTATIRDMSGRDVFERTLDVTNWPIAHLRNMAELLPGAYLIELRSSRSGVVGHVRAIRI